MIASRPSSLLGGLCKRDEHLPGPWCPCSTYATPEEREVAYWSLPDDVRRTMFARFEYDPDARDAWQHAMENDLDPTLVQIERGLLTREELAGIVAGARSPGTGKLHTDERAERAEAARHALGG